jgi:hypothetical protein
LHGHFVLPFKFGCARTRTLIATSPHTVDFPVTGGSALRLLFTLLSLSLSLPPVVVTPAFLTMQPIAIGPANFSLRPSSIHQSRMRTPILLFVASSPRRG